MHEAGNSHRAYSWIQTVVLLSLRHVYKHQRFASILPLAPNASYLFVVSVPAERSHVNSRMAVDPNLKE